MKIMFAVLAALVVSSAASAQAPIERPEWRSGDSWTYSFKNGQEAFEFAREVTGRDGSNTVTLSKREGREPRQGIFTPDLNLLRTIDGTTTDTGWFSFPLTTGKTWASSYSWSDGNGHLEMVFKVAGPEKITVKAGTFDAVKVVGKGRWFNHRTNGSDMTEMELWYAPAVHGYVRFHEWRWFQGSIGLDANEELTSYKLAD